MTISTGNSLQKTSSGSIEASVSALSGIGVCLAAGALAVAADALVRIPMQLPGWRGLIVMALFVAARCATGRSWAASCSACAAAAFGFALGGLGPQGALAYLAPGLIIDAVCLLGSPWRNRSVLFGVAGGVGNAAKFAVALVVGGFGQRGFGGSGLIVPLLNHFAFGLAGGLAAAFFLLRARR